LLPSPFWLTKGAVGFDQGGMIGDMNKRYKKLGYLAVLLLVDGLFFSLVDPRKAHALVIIVGFGLVVVTLYVLLDLLLMIVERVITLSTRTRRHLQDSITMLGGLLLAMQSIGQLTVKDMLAIIPLVAVLAFYLSYQRKETT
jgi:hypothetical protein